jgi:hypothetical protein
MPPNTMSRHDTPRSQPAPKQPARRCSTLLLPLVWLKRFFVRDLTLKRDGPNYHVAWVETICQDEDGPAAEPPRGVAPAGMRDELTVLLGRHAGTRQLMRHLAFIERALQLTGPEALAGLPPEVLQKGLQQLESLVPNWSSPGLAALRTQLGESLAAQQAATERKAPANNGKLSDFNEPQRVQVSEGTPSAFEALERIWIENRPDVAGAVKATKPRPE